MITKENILKLLGASIAGFVAYLVTAGIPNIPGWGKMIIVGVAAVIGIFVVRGNEAHIFSYGTGFLGSFLMMHGLGTFLGGFPPLVMEDLNEQKLTNKFIGYLAGIFVFTIIGGQVQIKKIAESEGDFMSSP